MERIIQTGATPGLFTGILSKSLGMKPIIGIAMACSAAAFVGGISIANHFNSHAQLKAERAEAKLEVKRLEATIAIERGLVKSKEDIIGDYKEKEQERAKEVKELRADYAALRAATPVNTIRYLERNEDKADAEINKNPDTAWIRNELPDWMLDDLEQTLSRPKTP